MAAACVSFWHGRALGPIERACIRSMLRHGHSLALYAYDPPDGVPTGVEMRDAATVLPRDLLFHHRNGSPGMFADWFRYELLRRDCGTWVDIDLYFLAPLDERRPYLFGLQEPGIINNAVLRLPSGSPLLNGLLRIFEEDAAPVRWLSARERLADTWKRNVMRERSAARLPWGATGPRALTAIAKELGLSHWALPIETFYPMPWQRADWIADPAVRLEEVAGDRTVAVHLWNQLIGPLMDMPPHPGSFLARLVSEGAGE